MMGVSFESYTRLRHLFISWLIWSECWSNWWRRRRIAGNRRYPTDANAWRLGGKRLNHGGGCGSKGLQSLTIYERVTPRMLGSATDRTKREQHSSTCSKQTSPLAPGRDRLFATAQGNEYTRSLRNSLYELHEMEGKKFGTGKITKRLWNHFLSGLFFTQHLELFMLMNHHLRNFQFRRFVRNIDFEWGFLILRVISFRRLSDKSVLILYQLLSNIQWNGSRYWKAETSADQHQRSPSWMVQLSRSHVDVDGLSRNSEIMSSKKKWSIPYLLFFQQSYKFQTGRLESSEHEIQNCDFFPYWKFNMSNYRSRFKNFFFAKSIFKNLFPSIGQSEK